ncbi:MAG: acyl-CoA transferase [Rhodospirillaceae bacterium]
MMTASVRENALTTLLTVIRSACPQAERETVTPERVGPDGLVILRDGEPGVPDITLSPLTYSYDHRAELELFVPTTATDDGAAALDRLARTLGTAFAADRRLGGAVDWLDWSPPATTGLAVSGGAPIRAAFLTVTLTYTTTNPCQ